MTFYPEKINFRLRPAKNAGNLPNADAAGTEVDFSCGVSIRFFLKFDAESKTISAVKFKTNGCGYVIAAADFLTEWIAAKNLADLHGLTDLADAVSFEFGDIPPGRAHCIDLCRHALENAFAEYRTSQIAEWSGEKALICTCFGVEEETIEEIVARENLSSVESVGEKCSAGTGCGSCQPLIQEILDSVEVK